MFSGGVGSCKRRHRIAWPFIPSGKAPSKAGHECAERTGSGKLKLCEWWVVTIHIENNKDRAGQDVKDESEVGKRSSRDTNTRTRIPAHKSVKQSVLAARNQLTLRTSEYAKISLKR